MGHTTYLYCRSWFRANRRATEAWSEAQARLAHEQKKEYTVLCGGDKKPNAIILVSSGTNFVLVSFLDELARPELEYAFKQYEPGKLFLKKVQLLGYKGNSNLLSFNDMTKFKQDGRIDGTRTKFMPDERRLIERWNGESDLIENYDTFPDFGDYETLLRRER